MNVFFEFHKVVQGLQKENVSYALIGGVAMAYYGNARFTKDMKKSWSTLLKIYSTEQEKIDFNELSQ